MLILDPSGGLLQMPVVSLENSPFTNFLIPGMVLTLLLGIIPAFTAFCLIKRPRVKWVNLLNLYSDKHCGWTYSLYTGLMLIIWITVQVAIIGYGHIIQTVYASVGILITIMTLLPGVMKYYQKEDEPETGVWRTL